jgi:hypothetical protein
MPSGLGHKKHGKPSSGKHYIRGGDFPDSYCGAGYDLVYRIEETTCLACLEVLRRRGLEAGKQMSRLEM